MVYDRLKVWRSRVTFASRQLNTGFRVVWHFGSVAARGSGVGVQSVNRNPPPTSHNWVMISSLQVDANDPSADRERIEGARVD
jgi:hypothetical protein